MDLRQFFCGIARNVCRCSALIPYPGHSFILALLPVMWLIRGFFQHRLIYVIGVLGLIHFLLLVKADLREPLLYATLLAWRWFAVRWRPSRPALAGR